MVNHSLLQLASDMQQEALQKFAGKYNWDMFQEGCYLKHNDVELLLMINDKPDVLEVQLRQTRAFTLGDRIASACNISLLETENHKIEHSVMLAYKELYNELCRFSNNNKDVKESLLSFFEHLKASLEINMNLHLE